MRKRLFLTICLLIFLSHSVAFAQTEDVSLIVSPNDKEIVLQAINEYLSAKRFECQTFFEKAEGPLEEGLSQKEEFALRESFTFAAEECNDEVKRIKSVIDKLNEQEGEGAPER